MLATIGVKSIAGLSTILISFLAVSGSLLAIISNTSAFIAAFLSFNSLAICVNPTISHSSNVPNLGSIRQEISVLGVTSSILVEHSSITFNHTQSRKASSLQRISLALLQALPILYLACCFSLACGELVSI